MPLIKCPECGKEVSDTSDVCIHCGYKFKNTDTNLVEFTSKKLKGQKLIAMGIFFVGVMSIVFSFNNPTALIIESIVSFIALIWIIAIEIKIWWRHK